MQLHSSISKNVKEICKNLVVVLDFDNFSLNTEMKRKHHQLIKIPKDAPEYVEWKKNYVVVEYKNRILIVMEVIFKHLSISQY